MEEKTLKGSKLVGSGHEASGQSFFVCFFLSCPEEISNRTMIAVEHHLHCSSCTQVINTGCYNRTLQYIYFTTKLTLIPTAFLHGVMVSDASIIHLRNCD